jgi:hypothetical protein
VVIHLCSIGLYARIAHSNSGSEIRNEVMLQRKLGVDAWRLLSSGPKHNRRTIQVKRIEAPPVIKITPTVPTYGLRPSGKRAAYPLRQ